MASLFLKVIVIVLLGIIWQWIERNRRLPPVVEGFFRPEYRPVAEYFRKLVEDGTERGGSFAVYQRGQPLVELWGGYADPASVRPWRNDTLTMVWSCTKGVSAVAVAKLAERGLLDYKKEVREYWPEFAQNGKANITVEMLLSHQAGLGSLGHQTISLHEYKHEWVKVEQMMVSAPPDFPPGTAVGYQAFTFGMYVDALIRKVDPKHRNLTQFFDEEIAKPYGIDFYIGLPLEKYHRAARQERPSVWASLQLLLDPAHYPLLWEFIFNPQGYTIRSTHTLDFFKANTGGVVNDPYQMEVGLGSLMGFGSAPSLARLYDFLANEGTIKGKQLLPKTLTQLFSVPLTDSLPKVISGADERLRFSQGFKVYKKPSGLQFGHDGYGGQLSTADPQRGLGLAYITNFQSANMLAPPDHAIELEKIFYECYMKYQDGNSKSDSR